MPDYTVLVSLDGGKQWSRFPDEIPASTREVACEKVRELGDLKGDASAQFYATSTFNPLQKTKQLVEKWAWRGAKDEPPQQETLA